MEVNAEMHQLTKTYEGRYDIRHGLQPHSSGCVLGAAVKLLIVEVEGEIYVKSMVIMHGTHIGTKPSEEELKQIQNERARKRMAERRAAAKKNP